MKNNNNRYKKFIFSAIIVLMILTAFWLTWRNFHQPKTPTVWGELNQSVKQNQKIFIPIFVNTEDKTINALEVYLKFDPNELRVESVSKDNSFFQLWIKDEPKFNNDKGEISFAGGLPNPGFKGTGQIGSIEITPLKAGLLTISFDGRTRMLLNDGVGTESALISQPIKIRVK